MKHASMVPLIGGMTLASDEVFGNPATALFSYDVFASNDSHLRNWYAQKGIDVPYYTIGKDELPRGLMKTGLIDSVDSTCPCAGLSAFSVTMGADNPMNQWMLKSAEFVLGEVQPRVYWGENAPALVSHVGRPVLEKLAATGKKNGYVMSVYRTKSLLHGIPQVRNRTFYFFWKGDKVPVFNWFKRPYQRIEDLIMGVKSNFQSEPINLNTPSKEPFYQYVLEEIYGGITHRQFCEEHVKNLPVRDNDAKSIIERTPDHSYERVAVWMDKKGYTKEAEKCRRIGPKLEKGGNIMRRDTVVPYDKIGAFIGHYPKMLAHPREDRYISYREAMTIMGLPSDFELLNPTKNYNHICQNVPMSTAKDMASEVYACLSDPKSRDWKKTDMLIQYNTQQTLDFKERSPSLSEFFGPSTLDTFHSAP